MRAIREHIDLEIAILYPQTVFSNAPIRFGIGIMAAIIPLQILVVNLSKQRGASFLDRVDIDFGARKVGPNGATVDRYDGVFKPIARHIGVNDPIGRDSEIDILALEFAVTYAH